MLLFAKISKIMLWLLFLQTSPSGLSKLGRKVVQFSWDPHPQSQTLITWVSASPYTSLLKFLLPTQTWNWLPLTSVNLIGSYEPVTIKPAVARSNRERGFYISTAGLLAEQIDCIWLNGSHQNPVIKLWEQALNEADGLSNRAELKPLISCSVTAAIIRRGKGFRISLVSKFNNAGAR